MMDKKNIHPEGLGGEPVREDAHRSPSGSEYRCKFTDCRLTPSGEFREPRIGDHFLSSAFGPTQAAIDFDVERPILRHVGEPTAKCKEYHARWGLRPQEGEALPEAKPKGPSIIFGHPNEKPYQYHFNPDPDAIVQAPEVTQPGEGVEALDILGAIKLDIGMAEWGSHEDGAAMYREFIDTWYPRIKKLLAKAGRAA